MQELRGKRVAQMVIDLSEQGVEVSIADEMILRAYVVGTISGRDLLAHVTQFGDLTAYQDWLLVRSNESSLHSAFHVPVEQLLREVHNEFLRRFSISQVKVVNTPAIYEAVIAYLRPFNLGARMPSVFGSVDRPSNMA